MDCLHLCSRRCRPCRGFDSGQSRPRCVENLGCAGAATASRGCPPASSPVASQKPRGNGRRKHLILRRRNRPDLVFQKQVILENLRTGFAKETASRGTVLRHPGFRQGGPRRLKYTYFIVPSDFLGRLVMETKTGCFLCEVPQDLMYAESETAIALCGLGPLVPGYTVVGTKAHVASAVCVCASAEMKWWRKSWMRHSTRASFFAVCHAFFHEPKDLLGSAS